MVVGANNLVFQCLVDWRFHSKLVMKTAYVGEKIGVCSIKATERLYFHQASISTEATVQNFALSVVPWCWWFEKSYSVYWNTIHRKNVYLSFQYNSDLYSVLSLIQRISWHLLTPLLSPSGDLLYVNISSRASSKAKNQNKTMWAEIK